MTVRSANIDTCHVQKIAGYIYERAIQLMLSLASGNNGILSVE